jgi:hypothetical protein
MTETLVEPKAPTTEAPFLLPDRPEAVEQQMRHGFERAQKVAEKRDRDKPGIPKPTDAEPDRPKSEVTPEKSPAAKEEPAPERTSASDMSDDQRLALEEAITVLRRGKVPQAVIRKMSNADILEYSGTLRSSQAATDKKLQELGERAKASKETSEKPAESAPTAESPVDWKSLVQPFADELSEKSLTALAALFEGQEKRNAERFKVYEGIKAKQEAEIARSREATAEILLSTTRSTLLPQWPQLADPAVSEKVLDRMHRLSKGGGYQGTDSEMMSAVMADACRLVIGSELPAADVSSQRQRAQATPDTDSKKKTPSSMSADERAREAFERLRIPGADPRAIRRELAV